MTTFGGETSRGKCAFGGFGSTCAGRSTVWWTVGDATNSSLAVDSSLSTKTASALLFLRSMARLGSDTEMCLRLNVSAPLYSARWLGGDKYAPKFAEFVRFNFLRFTYRCFFADETTGAYEIASSLSV